MRDLRAMSLNSLEIAASEASAYTLSVVMGILSLLAGVVFGAVAQLRPRQQRIQKTKKMIKPSGQTKKLRVVIVGAGYVARHHIAALRRLDFVEIVAVCDLDVGAAQVLAKANGIPNALTRLS